MKQHVKGYETKGVLMSILEKVWKKNECNLSNVVPFLAIILDHE